MGYYWDIMGYNGIYNHRTWDVDQETWWANEWANEWEKVESINLDAFDHDLIVIRHWNDGIVWGIIPSHGLISECVSRLGRATMTRREALFQ